MAFITIKDKNDFQFNPKLSVDNFDGVSATLFDKEVFFRDEYWLRNIHLKITDVCNARCNFCIEKGSNVPENKERFLTNLESLLHQMDEQGILSTVTITGGEPTLCKHLPEALEMLSRYNTFSSMNSTGRDIKDMDNAPDWINISKHYFNDSDIFGLNNLNPKDIIGIKDKTGSKIRLQALLLPEKLEKVSDILRYINTYKDIADDFGFRQLIKVDDDYNVPSLTPFRKYLYHRAEFVEQVIQDYYVYETWNLEGKDITLSMSDMGMLAENEKIENKANLREVIIHPDGVVSGDWGRKTKILTL